MLPPIRVIVGALVAATATTLVACGGDDPLGKRDAGAPAPVSRETTTAQLAKAAIDHALPSVVAVSVTRGGSTTTGTGTVFKRGLIVTDAALVRQPTAPAERATPKPSPKSEPASTTPTGTTPSGTTPEGTTPTGTTPTGTTPVATSTPKPTTRPLPKSTAPATITVRERSGDEHTATLQGVDAVSGLAVLRVNELDTVPAAKAGAAPTLGQELASVGYYVARRPAVRPGTVVTLGRSSRKNRESEVGLIEATAPLGTQGIGGPLVDGRGQVVAVMTRAVEPNVPGAVVGLPYASVVRIGKALADSGRVRRAYLGLDTVGITPTRAEELRLSTSTGVLIQGIVKGSPASFSTLRPPTGREWIAGRLVPTGSDAITQIDGKPIASPEDIDAVLATKQPGDRIALRSIRGSHGVTVHVTLGER
ncbi:MAG: serine protease [Solirubrobacteraceae bacterium]|nr:serine protease [Solirubrobacteraceae bacterium]